MQHETSWQAFSSQVRFFLSFLIYSYLAFKIDISAMLYWLLYKELSIRMVYQWNRLLWFHQSDLKSVKIFYVLSSTRTSGNYVRKGLNLSRHEGTGPQRYNGGREWKTFKNLLRWRSYSRIYNLLESRWRFF